MPCRLLPTDRDGIPNVLVEAMAAGAPVVATAVSGIPELVEHEVNGLLVAPDDPEALADALLRLHATPSCAARLTRRGRATVRERFDGERLAARARRAVRARRWRHERVDRARPRPVFCVNEHEHRDRELAEAVAAGRFTSRARRGRSGSSPTGSAPTCRKTRSGGSTGSSSTTGSTSPHAFRATGDTRFRDAWERLVALVIRQVPPDHDASDVTARRILNWIYAWQRLAGSRRSPGARGEHRASRRGTCAPTSRRAQPPHARALRAADRRARPA